MNHKLNHHIIYITLSLYDGSLSILYITSLLIYKHMMMIII